MKKFLFFLCLLMMPFAVHSQNYSNWTGTGNWSSSGNWSSGTGYGQLSFQGAGSANNGACFFQELFPTISQALALLIYLTTVVKTVGFLVMLVPIKPSIFQSILTMVAQDRLGLRREAMGI